VGAPGAGKSHVLLNRFIPLMTKRYGAPPKEDFCHIDPDLFISSLCNNDNAHRCSPE